MSARLVCVLVGLDEHQLGEKSSGTSPLSLTKSAATPEEAHPLQQSALAVPSSSFARTSLWSLHAIATTMNVSSEGEYWNDNIRSSKPLSQLSPTPSRSHHPTATDPAVRGGVTQSSSGVTRQPSHLPVASDEEDYLFVPFHNRSSSRSSSAKVVPDSCNELESKKKHVQVNSSPMKSAATPFTPKPIRKSSLSRSNSTNGMHPTSTSSNSPGPVAAMSPLRRKVLVPVPSRSTTTTLTPRRNRLQQQPGKLQPQQQPPENHLEVDWSRCTMAADDPPGSNFDDDVIYNNKGGFFGGGGDDAETTSTQHTPSSSSHTGSTITNTISPSSRTAASPLQRQQRSTVTTTRSSHYTSNSPPVPQSTTTSSSHCSTTMMLTPRRSGVARSRSRRLNVQTAEVSPSPRVDDGGRKAQGWNDPADAEDDDDDGAVFAKIDFRHIDQLFLFPFEETPQATQAPPPPGTPPARRMGFKRSNSHRRPGPHRQASPRIASSENQRILRRPSKDSSTDFAPPPLGSRLVSDQARIPYHRSLTKRLKDQEERERANMLLQIRNRSALPTSEARPPTPPRQRRLSTLPPSPRTPRRPPASPRRPPPTRTSSTGSAASVERETTTNRTTYGNTRASPVSQGRHRKTLGPAIRRVPTDGMDDDHTDIFGTNVDQLSAFEDSFTELITWTRFRK